MRIRSHNLPKPSWTTRWWLRRFLPEIEREYRADLRAVLRPTRTGLFAIIAIVFAAGPLYHLELFEPPPQLIPVLVAIELTVALVAAAASVALQRSASQAIAQPLQAAAVLIMLGAVLALRYLSLKAGMNYPSGMVGVALLAIVFFGGFDWHRLVPLAFATIAAAITLELTYEPDAALAAVAGYLLLFMGVIAIMGALNQEVLSRRRWWKTRQLREARSALVQSEQRFEAFMENSPALTCIKDGQGRYVVRNKAFRERYGEPGEDWTGRRPDAFFPPNEARKALDTDRKVLESQRACDYELTSTDRRGRATDLWVHKFPLQGSDGDRYVGMIAFDITERVRLEKELRGTEFRFQMFLDHNTALSWMKDEEGRYLFMSAPYCRFLNIAPDSWPGHTDRDYFPERVAQMARDLELWVLDMEQPIESVETLPDARGREFQYKVVRFPFNDQTGRRFVGGWATDVSQLQSAQQAAQAAALAKSEFLANTSHEIRTPMNSIVGMASLLADSNLTMEQKEWLRVIRSSSEHLLTIINDILDLSKVEAGMLGLEVLPFRLFDCVQSAIDVVAQPAAAKSVELTCAIEPDVPEGLLGDAARLRQVLMNVLSNAIKFTPAGGRVAVSVRSRPRGRRFELTFSVTDTGVGISAEQMEKLFKPFSQADASITRSHGGTGLGLSISRRLLSLMGGQIGVESEPGKGSTFTFTVHLAGATVEARPPAQAEPDLPHDLAASLPLRILVAEDDQFNQQVARLLLNRMGYQPDIVGDGRAALDAVERNVYDVVLMDMQMPVMDGFTAARELCRRWSKQARPRLVGVSANATADDRRSGAEAGLDDYIAKPFTPPVLVEALRRCSRIELESRA